MEKAARYRRDSAFVTKESSGMESTFIIDITTLPYMDFWQENGIIEKKSRWLLELDSYLPSEFIRFTFEKACLQAFLLFTGYLPPN